MKSQQTQHTAEDLQPLVFKDGNISKVAGLSQLLSSFTKRVSISYSSTSTIGTYRRAVRDLSLFWGCLPTEIETDQILDYLHALKDKDLSWSKIKLDVAALNYRLLKLDKGQITFSYRDRTAGDVKRVMSLPVKEFLLRFKQHILPKGFVKIRHYGLFGTRVKKEKLALVREALGEKQKAKLQKLSLQEVVLKTMQQNIYQCKSCRDGNLVIVKLLPPTRGSPVNQGANKRQYYPMKKSL